MNNTIDKILHQLRTEYEWKYKKYTHFSPKHLKREEDPEKVSKLIYDLIATGKPCMIARYGMTEFNALANYLCVQKGVHSLLKFLLCKTHAWWLSMYRLKNLRDYSGFFPISFPLYERFCKLLIEDTKYVDILASWIDDEVYMEGYLQNAEKIFLPYLEPYYSSKPWSKILEGKKVLVVHPFSEQILRQYKLNQEKLFNNTNVLPSFSLEVIKSVQSLGGDNHGYKNWFSALNHMKEEIDKRDYDICIIGCGAYGFHLAAHIKRNGKQAIHLGGATQLLFGIKGNRWENPNYGVHEWGIPYGFYTKMFNEYWIKPGDNGKAKNASQVEGACYW